MEKRILIRMNEPEDWLRTWDEGTQVVNDFILPRGRYMKDEVSDTIYHKDAEVPYHQHGRGTETFLIAKGSVECFIRGKRFIANAGDILHIPPYTPHGFHFLEEGTIWRELFQEIDMAQGIYEKNTVNQRHIQFRENEEFMEMYRNDGTEGLERELPVTEDVDKHQMHEVRTPDFAYVTHNGEGWEIRQKVGRWECGGVKEVWEAFLQKGLCVEWHYPNQNWELYYVADGKIRFDVEGETYIAEKDCLVHIPPYHTHELEVLEDARVFDYGGETCTLELLEDYKSFQTHQPEKLKDPDFFEGFLHKYRCYVTGCYMK
ncbi:cupin domain-containing protein [Ihubacter sp. rT4E-8]|uniref:cupin domain-containing protein n=1 Tax=unclassified Ihubacter TaxID=2633299 RepID=UPI003C7CC26C